MEVVASKKGGSLSIAINAKNLNTDLTDKVSSNIQNDIQDIEISSTIVLESYVIIFLELIKNFINKFLFYSIEHRLQYFSFSSRKWDIGGSANNNKQFDIG